MNQHFFHWFDTNNKRNRCDFSKILSKITNSKNELEFQSNLKEIKDYN